MYKRQFQNNRLFKASILENVRAARPDASREQALAALEAAQCGDCLLYTSRCV